MSANGSPISAPIQPLHNPDQAAHVVVPKAPLGNVANQPAALGAGAKALLAKKMAKNINPTYISPTDNLMTPCTQKLSAAKKKHFTKGNKPIQLFAPAEEKTDESDDEEAVAPTSDQQPAAAMQVDDDENPF
ncbi:RING-type domain-containing protein [Mycena chlorophos]|uniref:RING-type domain-containing protein n=1 Tax=Mycena chlorophos TaxID=658473 RepID=A0A8H6TBF8_MYCCL|nr:RING-type domain-containing protein [Mycena chlorophos]